ncbi:MAG: hypothetical protein ACPG7F_09180 [Aggregatilineales bacterium]
MDGERLETLQIIWVFMIFAQIALFISGAASGGLTGIHIAMSIVLLIATFGASGMMWYITGQNSQGHAEKAKRDRLEQVLRNLSDSELVALKQRLSDEAIDDSMLYAHLTDDGEIEYEQGGG